MSAPVEITERADAAASVAPPAADAARDEASGTVVDPIARDAGAALVSAAARRGRPRACASRHLSLLLAWLVIAIVIAVGRRARGCSPGRTRSPACPPRSCRRPSLAHLVRHRRDRPRPLHARRLRRRPLAVGRVRRRDGRTRRGHAARRRSPGSLGGVVDDDPDAARRRAARRSPGCCSRSVDHHPARLRHRERGHRRRRRQRSPRSPGSPGRRWCACAGPTTSRPRSAAAARSARRARAVTCCPTRSRPSSASPRCSSARAILAISTLGFLGYGAPPPTPEWGLLIAEGRNYVATSWWLTTLPGLVVVVVVLAANRISQSLGRRTR